ncbi:hypothetical protein V1511DRAFT_500748 [Dipodascopsis uninucleata]
MAFSLFGGSGSPTASAASSSPTDELKNKLKQQLAQELAIANATELINKISSNCFEKCIVNPGPTLSSADQVWLIRE